MAVAVETVAVMGCPGSSYTSPPSEPLYETQAVVEKSMIMNEVVNKMLMWYIPL